MKTNNPRFPHTCKIYRITGEDSFEDGKEIIIYEGKCNKYGNSSLRTFKTNGVIRGDYAVDVPGLVKGIVSGDVLDVTDYSGTFEACMLTDCYASDMGTTVYFNLAKN